MKLLIIGNGFIGSRLKELHPQADVADIAKRTPETILFDCTNTKDWKTLDSYTHLVFTCKLDDISTAKALASYVKFKHVIIISTAKAFATSNINATITENSSLIDSPRNLAENHFIHFATILHPGLIWGDDRSPERWLKNGKIKNGNKYVNFIYGQDLCRIISSILILNKPYGRVLVSDGNPQKWQQLADSYKLSLASKKCGLESKKICNHKLLSILSNNFKFNNP